MRPSGYFLRAVSFAVLSWLAAAACAAEPVSVSNAWVRATVPGQSTGSAYMDLTAGAPATLVAAQSAVAAKVQLHSMAMDGGVMKMRAVAKVELPAHQTVSLNPGGYHLMLVDLNHQLKAGERVPLSLVVADAKGVKTTLKLDVEVRASAPEADHMHMPH